VFLQKRRRMTQTLAFRLLVISRPDKSGHPLQRGIKKKRDASVSEHDNDKLHVIPAQAGISDTTCSNRFRPIGRS